MSPHFKLTSILQIIEAAAAGIAKSAGGNLGTDITLALELAQIIQNLIPHLNSAAKEMASSVPPSNLGSPHVAPTA